MSKNATNLIGALGTNRRTYSFDEISENGIHDYLMNIMPSTIYQLDSKQVCELHSTADSGKTAVPTLPWLERKRVFITCSYHSVWLGCYEVNPSVTIRAASKDGFNRFF